MDKYMSKYYCFETDGSSFKPSRLNRCLNRYTTLTSIDQRAWVGPLYAFHIVLQRKDAKSKHTKGSKERLVNVTPGNMRFFCVNPFVKRERERTQNSELYYSRIKILGNCLFLQSLLANLHANRGETERQTGRQTGRQAGREMEGGGGEETETDRDRDRQADRQADREMGGRGGRHTERQRQRDRQTDRQAGMRRERERMNE